MEKIWNEKRLLDVEEISFYLGLGRNMAMKLSKQAGAERRVGRRCLYDKVVIDKYLDECDESIQFLE